VAGEGEETLCARHSQLNNLGSASELVREAQVRERVTVSLSLISKVLGPSIFKQDSSRERAILSTLIVGLVLGLNTTEGDADGDLLLG